MTDAPPKGFRRRKGSKLLRTYVDFAEDEAARIASVAESESASTGERVSVQSVIRRATRKGLGRKGGAS